VTLNDLLDLLADNESAAGLAVTSVAIVAGAVVLRLLITPLVRRRFGTDHYRRYWAAKLTTYAITAVGIVLFIALWAPLGGRLSVILGFATAGVAFAMQEVIGALFGWLNIVAGRIYTVGDRIEVGGVRGDVLDITPLRTTVLEIGSDPDLEGGPTSWIGARQPTGRVVAVSNRKTFTEPVYNHSAHLDWVWEEVTVAVSRDADWRRAEQIVLAALRGYEPETRVHGEETLARLAERFLVSRADVEPRTFVRIAAGDIELVGRFVTAVRTSRHAKDAILRKVLDQLAADGIALAYPTYSVQLPRSEGAPAGVPPGPSGRAPG